MKIMPTLLVSVLVPLLALALASTALGGDPTVAGTASASAPAATWIAVDAPITGDDDRDGYTSYEIATSSAGPFSSSPVLWTYLAGPSEWRSNVFARGQIAPATTYFVRVTHFDPDGVSGPNPQVVGPITTPASSPASTVVGAATATPRLDEIFVRVPISGDGDFDSFATFEIATAAGGPWTRKCGGSPSASIPHHPKLCRLRALVPGTDYWVRVTVGDGDGVSGPNPQVLGPIRYAGLTDLALGKAISADPGWGCCPNPSHLVDGRIQNDAWFFGFAWRGGNSGWAGGTPGVKQATIDLGAPTTFDRAAVWYHDAAGVPLVWKFQASNDGATWSDLVSVSSPVCRTATLFFPGHWAHPGCAHDATFAPVTARFFRYLFDDRTLFGGIHGWAVEIEIFDTSEAAPPNAPPVADAGGDQDLAADESCQATAALDGSGSFDPDGDALTFSWSGPFGTASGETASVGLGLGSHTVTLTVDDGKGGTDSDDLVVDVSDETPPALTGVPGPVAAECASPDGTAVALAAPTAADHCDGAVAVSDDAPALYPLGTTTVTWSATDAAGNAASATTAVTVADTTPPAIAGASASPGELWPPNHEMRAVTVAVDAADACDGAAPACRIVAVTSNEAPDGAGDGSTAPDWAITGDLTVELRAERAGGGDGRVYTLEVVCTDAKGNAASAIAEVRVPHDRRR